MIPLLDYITANYYITPHIILITSHMADGGIDVSERIQFSFEIAVLPKWCFNF